MMKNVVNLCTEYVNSGKIEIDGYEYCGRKHIVIRNKQNKDEFVDISVEYKTITMHMNTIPKEFEALVDLCKKTKAKQISSAVAQVKNVAQSQDNQRGK